MAAVTVYEKFVIPQQEKLLMSILDDIKSDKYKVVVLQIQQLYSEGQKEEADNLKATLPGFTASCRCKGGRRTDLVTYYTGFIVLDLDDLSSDEMHRISHTLRTSEYVMGAFKSPSGAGIKILVETNGKQESHLSTYLAVADYFSTLLNVNIDTSGKDIVRYCFMSYDPDAYKNISNKIFDVELSEVSNVTVIEVPTSSTGNYESSSYSELFQAAVEMTCRSVQYEKGNRNNFVYHLANNCNRNGIPLEDAESLILASYPDEPLKAKASVRSAYNHHPGEFARSNVSDSNGEDLGEQLSSTPFLTDSIFDKLPSLLKDCCSVFPDRRERDMMLTGALGILSGCIPNVCGVYDGREMYPNLFTVIVAPPASGKGVLVFAQRLAEGYHSKLTQDFNHKMLAYKEELRQYKLRARHSKVDPGEEPQEPTQKILFIPADSSSAKVKKTLADCNGRGIICETESDTLGNTFKQDWGGYSDLLRKSFHHERVSNNRVSTSLIEIPNPCLSTVLTGTPGQILSLIQSSENGLFSRFLFYSFRSEASWKDVSPAAYKTNLTDHFKKIQSRVTAMIEFFDNQSPIQFQMSSKQWELLNNRCSDLLSKYTILISDDMSSSIYRLGLISFRIAMIFSALRKYEDAITSSTLSCLDIDIDLALTLIESYIFHTVVMFQYLPKRSGVKLDPKRRKFLEYLPDHFDRSQAVLIGAQLSIAQRTVDLYLAKFQPSLLKKDDYGKYKKV